MECDTIARSRKINSPGEDTDFNDYSIITPLRFLLMKQKDPKSYENLISLVSNIESKVSKPVYFSVYVYINNIIYEVYLMFISR